MCLLNSKDAVYGGFRDREERKRSVRIEKEETKSRQVGKGRWMNNKVNLVLHIAHCRGR